MTQRKIQYWVIPPKANGEFVANREKVLETYAKRYDSCFPVLCMDEQPVQLLEELATHQLRRSFWCVIISTHIRWDHSTKYFRLSKHTNFPKESSSGTHPNTEVG